MIIPIGTTPLPEGFFASSVDSVSGESRDKAAKSERLGKNKERHQQVVKHTIVDGLSGYQIADKIKASRSSVSRHLKKYRKDVLAVCGLSVEHLIPEEIERLNYLYSQAIEAWHLSKLPEEIITEIRTTSSDGVEKVSVSKSSKKREGDVRYLVACITLQKEKIKHSLPQGTRQKITCEEIRMPSGSRATVISVDGVPDLAESVDHLIKSATDEQLLQLIQAQSSSTEATTSESPSVEESVKQIEHQ